MEIIQISGMVLGLVAVFSEAGLASKYKPLVSLSIGVLIALVGVGVSKEAVMLGIMAGLSASGLWAGTKATMSKTEIIEDRG